mgnify:CR=1 FL=1
MNRALLKQDAKNAMSLANPHPVLTTLVLIAVSLAASMIFGVVTNLFNFTGFITGYAAFSLIGALVAMVSGVVISLLLATVQFGYTVYCLKVFKQEETGINELFAYFPMLLKVFGLSLWICLFVMLWSCLCYIPGIIAALRYSQAFFILAENPEKGIRECVNESKELMSGRLWEFFVLQLSFILWGILTVITCGIASLYVQPYMTTTYAGYYLSLKPVNSYDGGQAAYSDPVFNAGQDYGSQGSNGQF